MHDFRRLLVGLAADASGEGLGPGSVKAARQARALARVTGASVTLLHSSWHDEDEPDPDPGDALDAVAEECREDGVPVTVTRVEERPWLALVQRVLRDGDDLALVGKRNRGVADGRRLGRNTRELLRACPAPVWVVHPVHELAHDVLLAATDLSPVGDRATRLAASLAQITEATLHVVHAWQMPMELQLEHSRLEEDEFAQRVRELEKRMLAHIHDALGAADDVLHPKVHLGRDAPARAILACVERYDPDVIVMGTVSRTGIPGLVMGNTAERLLDKVDCSLLTIKPEDFVSPVSTRSS